MYAVLLRSNKERPVVLTVEQSGRLRALDAPQPHPLVAVWHVLVADRLLRVLEQLVKRQRRVTVAEQLTAPAASTASSV